MTVQSFNRNFNSDKKQNKENKNLVNLKKSKKNIGSQRLICYYVHYLIVAAVVRLKLLF